MKLTKQKLEQLIKEEIEKQFSKEQKEEIEKQFSKEQKCSVDEGLGRLVGKNFKKRSNCGPYNRASCEKQVEMLATLARIDSTLSEVLNQLSMLQEKR